MSAMSVPSSPLALRQPLLGVRRVVASVWGQLVLETWVLGLGLYVADVASDVLSAIRLWSLEDIANDGGYRTYSLLIMGFVLTPGLLVGIQAAVFRGKLDLGFDGPARGAKELGSVVFVLMVPFYIAFMPFFWIFVPVIKYLQLSVHLLRVQFSGVPYDDGARESVWRARELEGLGETLLQLTMNVQLVVLTYSHQHDAAGLSQCIFPDLIRNPEFTNFIPYLQMLTSGFSFVWTVVCSQSTQVRRVGRVRSASPGFWLWHLALCVSEASARVGLYTTFAWTLRPSAALVVFVALCLCACHPLLFVSFAGDAAVASRSYLTDVLLSALAPINFVRARAEDTQRFLALYKGAHLVALVATSVMVVAAARTQGDDHWGLSNFVQLAGSKDYALRFLSVSWSLFLLSLLCAVCFWRRALSPLYRHHRLSHPHMLHLRRRLRSFPPDLRLPDRAALAAQGHFYADHRLTASRTACFCCGRTVEHPAASVDEAEVAVEADALHLPGCVATHQDCCVNGGGGGDANC